MKVFVGQIYIAPGATFPFSLRFQKWLGDELTQRIEVSDAFRNAFSEEFDLGFRVSAKSEIQEPEIKGPTVFKRAKNVEFTIFLPHKSRDYYSPGACRETVRLLLHSIVRALDELQIDSTKVDNDASTLLAHFLVAPELMDRPGFEARRN